MGFGFVVARFGLFLRELAAPTSHPRPALGLSMWIGGGLVVLGVLVNLAAAVGHVRLLRRLGRGEAYRVTTWSLGFVVTILLACLGVGLTAYLFLWSQ